MPKDQAMSRSTTKMSIFLSRKWFPAVNRRTKSTARQLFPKAKLSGVEEMLGNQDVGAFEGSEWVTPQSCQQCKDEILSSIFRGTLLLFLVTILWDRWTKHSSGTAGYFTFRKVLIDDKEQRRARCVSGDVDVVDESIKQWGTRMSVWWRYYSVKSTATLSFPDGYHTFPHVYFNDKHLISTYTRNDSNRLLDF